MEKLTQPQPQKSEEITPISNFATIKAGIALAIERTNSQPFNIDNATNDILNCFPTATTGFLIEAIKAGSFGEYGSTFRLSVQEICIWIRKSKENNAIRNRTKGALFIVKPKQSDFFNLEQFERAKTQYEKNISFELENYHKKRLS